MVNLKAFFFFSVYKLLVALFRIGSQIMINYDKGLQIIAIYHRES